MISRSAEQCFWLCRHLERINHIACFMSVNHNYILDTNLDEYDRWFPFVIVIGEEKRFLKIFGEKNVTNNRLIENYIIWDEENPVSIYQMSKAARENARVIRDIISNELWESINSFWLWLVSSSGRRLYLKDKLAFYKTIKNNINSLYGQLYSSMLKSEAYYFMMLGMVLERTNQTARIVDVKSHRISFYESSERETALETLYWLNLLKFFSAHEAFLKQKNIIDRKHVAEFLIFEKSFPHTITYCLNKSLSIIMQLQSITRVGNDIKPVEIAIKKVSEANIETILKHGLNGFLTDVINQVSKICDDIECTFFDPEISYINNIEGLTQ